MFYKEKHPPPGRSPRQVKAIRIITTAEKGGDIPALLAFFAPAWEHVEILDHPPRISMSVGSRHFAAGEGAWVVSPFKDAYLPMTNEDFRRKYEEVRD